MYIIAFAFTNNNDKKCIGKRCLWAQFISQQACSKLWLNGSFAHSLWNRNNLTWITDWPVVLGWNLYISRYADAKLYFGMLIYCWLPSPIHTRSGLNYRWVFSRLVTRPMWKASSLACICLYLPTCVVQSEAVSHLRMLSSLKYPDVNSFFRLRKLPMSALGKNTSHIWYLRWHFSGTTTRIADAAATAAVIFVSLPPFHALTPSGERVHLRASESLYQFTAADIYIYIYIWGQFLDSVKKFPVQVGSQVSAGLCQITVTPLVVTINTYERHATQRYTSFTDQLISLFLLEFCRQCQLDIYIVIVRRHMFFLI